MTQHHQARKRFGQNFLVDTHIIRKIVNAIAPAADDNLVEIGPGQGAITSPLLQLCPGLTAIELDRDLAASLAEKFGDEQGFTLIQQDALAFDFASLYTGRPLRVTGNLPYNISTPLLFHLLNYHHLIADMHVMLQKEVVDRLAAAPGSKAYGRLSVMLQYYCQVEPLFTVPPEAFRPAPKVQSSVVKLTPYNPLPAAAVDEALFAQLVKACFQQRRKTLRNAMKPLLPTKEIDACMVESSLDPRSRAEQLSVADFVSLSNLLAGGSG